MNSISLQASQIQLAYEDHGEGPVVVLLHAFPLDSAIWQPQRATLAEGNRLLTPDFPGFGGSPRLQGVTIDGLADVIAEFLDHLGINERVVVVGLSMGGYVALAFARLYPQRLRALILADTKAEADDPAAKSGRDRSIELVTTQGTSVLIDQLIPKLVGESTRASQQKTVDTVRTIARRQSAEGIVVALRALRDRPDATPGLAHISVPTLVLVGEEDSVTPPEKAIELAGGIPDARLVTIAKAGHLSNLENPIPFNAALREFLDGLPSETRSSRTV